MESILNYIGKLDSTYIKEYIPDNVGIYAEPFAGSFNCGFNLISEGFVGSCLLNDKDEFISNFWDCVKDNPYKVYYFIMENYDACIKSSDYRKVLDRLRDSANKFERAAYEYIWCLTDKFSNKEDNQLKKINLDIRNVIKSANMLSGVTITNMDYYEVLDKYDSHNTLFMMDPPYNTKNVNRFYRNKPANFNHKKLRISLSRITGNWIVRYKKMNT